MTQQSELPLSELLRDRAASIHDISVCCAALQLGIERYGKHESVIERIDGNVKIILAIDVEIDRRLANG